MENKTLVIYYSFTGNSKRVAEYVKNKLNADILELEPAEPFSSDYDEVVEEWQNNDIKRDVEIIENNLNNNINSEINNNQKGLYFQGVGANMNEPYPYEVQKYNSDMIIISPQLDDWGEESADDTIALVEYFSSQGVSDEHAGLGLFAYDENVMTWIFNRVK